MACRVGILRWHRAGAPPAPSHGFVPPRGLRRLRVGGRHWRHHHGVEGRGGLRRQAPRGAPAELAPGLAAGGVDAQLALDLQFHQAPVVDGPQADRRHQRGGPRSGTGVLKPQRQAPERCAHRRPQEGAATQRVRPCAVGPVGGKIDGPSGGGLHAGSLNVFALCDGPLPHQARGPLPGGRAGLPLGSRRWRQSRRLGGLVHGLEGCR
mmetsp:Transcript_26873/g.85096  ORF Transcript_26873/g.85096 Transcript_26873/m.85096 type:complete len:208 (+) Transcript_26873:335-958(+)